MHAEARRGARIVRNRRMLFLHQLLILPNVGDRISTAKPTKVDSIVHWFAVPQTLVGRATAKAWRDEPAFRASPFSYRLRVSTFDNQTCVGAPIFLEHQIVRTLQPSQQTVCHAFSP